MHAGVWATLGDVRMTAALEGLGFDWVGIDAQHGHHDDRSVRDILSLRREPKATILVRVAANDPALIGRALDAGADGVIVPLVSNPAEAAAAVAAAHHPPTGTRSWGPLVGYDIDPSRPPLCAVMVETADALDHVEAIAATAGVDMIFVGPFDLSLGLGLELSELIADTTDSSPLQRIIAACRSAGIIAGAFAGAPERAVHLREHGFDWVAVDTDAGLLALGAASAMAASAAPLPPGRTR
jgi:4-hydroxy-2-oxoheptanedioate aldolase